MRIGAIHSRRSFRSQFAFVILMLAVAGCDRSESPSDKPANTTNGSLTLVVSGDTNGWITPCGCASNQSGGMLRRGTYLADVRGRGGAVVYADAGGAAGGTSGYHRTKFEAILAGELMLDVAAHNVGESEAAFGPAYLREVAARTRAPLISANIRDAAGGAILPASRVVTAAGRRVALVGVMSPRFKTSELSVSEPRAAVLEAAAKIKGQFDSLVVLAYLPQEELESLAAALPEADAVVGGPTGQSIAPRRVGPTTLAAATRKGKFLVEIPLAAGGGQAATGKAVEIVASLADEAGQQENLKRYLTTLEKLDLPATETGLVAPPPPNAPKDFRIAGSESCATCHRPDQDIWAHSKHNHAWDTLVTKGFHVDSSCQQCHTTGYGLPGGFVSRSASKTLVNVGCENCHGPSAAHVRDPKIRTPFVAADQCVRCHDQENSPTFNYDLYWPRTRHGRGQLPDLTPATKPAG